MDEFFDELKCSHCGSTQVVYADMSGLALCDVHLKNGGSFSELANKNTIAKIYNYSHPKIWKKN